MSIVTRVASKVGRFFRNAQLSSLPGAIATWFADHEGSVNSSGETINFRTALTIPTVYTAVRIIAESVASLPLLLYEFTGQGHEEATDHPLHYLLSVQPNPNMTAYSLIECICASLCLAGNAYVEIERNGLGQAVALWPLHPRHTEPQIINGKLIYKTHDGVFGEEPNVHRYIIPEDILHIPLFSFDGIRGFDPITLLRQSLGVAKAAERQGALWFGNSSMPLGGMLVNEDEMTPKQETEFRESWEKMQSGMHKGRIGVLTGKWKLQSIGLNAEQVQFLQTRIFQRSEIAAMYRLSPSQVGDTTRQANSNKVQENLSFVVDCLRPYLTRIEAEIIRKLLPSTGRKANKYKVSFDITERLRGDFLTTQQAYALGRQWGYLSGNDIRRAEGLNIGGPELDVYWYPTNMGNAKVLLSGSTPANNTVNSVRHLLPAWKAAFDTAIAIENDDYRDFHRAFSPVLTALSDALSVDAGPENDNIEPIIRSLYRRSQHWPPSHDPEYTDVMGAELAKTLELTARNLPAKVIQ
jgi:HK97 family phage portal protein